MEQQRYQWQEHRYGYPERRRWSQRCCRWWYYFFFDFRWILQFHKSQENGDVHGGHVLIKRTTRFTTVCIEQAKVSGRRHFPDRFCTYSVHRRRMASNEKAVISSFARRTCLHYHGVASSILRHGCFYRSFTSTLSVLDTRTASSAPLASLILLLRESD